MLSQVCNDELGIHAAKSGYRVYEYNAIYYAFTDNTIIINPLS